MPINIQIDDGNFSLGPTAGFFFTVDTSLDALLQVEADGTVVGSFPITNSQLRNPVTELHFDGTFFWTLEDLPSDLGLVIKKWRLFPFKTVAFPSVSPSELRWQDEITLINLPNIKYSAEAFVVEHYHREFDGSFLQGVNTIRLDDTTNLSLGTTLYLGPSAFGGFIGNEESIVVGGISGNDVSFVKGGGLENSYLSIDPVDFSKSIFLFNDHSFSGQEDNQGAIIQIAYPSKVQVRSDRGAKYSGVTAADFDSTIISFVRAYQIIQLDLTNPNFDLKSSAESNLVESDKVTLIKVHDLISDLSGSLYFKLQSKETTEDLGTGSLTTTDFDPEFNFQTTPTAPFVNSTALRMDKRFTEPLASAETIEVTAIIADQFNFPVFNESVQFSATLNAASDPGIPGTFSPTIVVTNVSGEAQSTYTPSSTETPILVDIQAEVI